MFHAGQRWASESEPELGLGLVERITERTVTVAFPASRELRQYAIGNAPLQRVQFHPGDTIVLQNGSSLRISQVIEKQGLLYYCDGAREVPETELSDRTSFNRPEERLLSGQIDSTEDFELRLAALEHQHRRRKSDVRGFVGGRIDLIPHQLYIASEVAGRLFPRVLLADEVGLGKTIEACLIVHRLLQTGRVGRVLVVVPEPLVHQWFVELLRRFNLWFNIFDEERCDAIETANPEGNPFLENQWVLCGMNFLTSPERQQQALAAGWDMLVVDEAHHLGWSPERVSPEYSAVQALGAKVPGLLLLTATPEQLGMASHFARLRLLDPDRYFDYAEFLKETEQYQEVALIADKLRREASLSSDEAGRLAFILARAEMEVRGDLAQLSQGNTAIRDRFIEELLDQHGTGRVMLRNTRATVTGFPPRIAHLYQLDALALDDPRSDRLADEFAADLDSQAAAAFQPDFSSDPRITWLADLLRQLDGQKVLLICRTRAKVEAIDQALRSKMNVKAALFHEGLPLVQRDRNAAWFAEEDGARILLASEIGSEGRNFQFAHHLVLFDLPLEPELLEQRIGRLDRIGQESDIHIHVPFVQGSPQEVLARWFQEGLNAFETNLRGGRQMLEEFGARVRDLALDFHETQAATRASLGELLSASRAESERTSAILEQGRDHLLELNSFRPQTAERLVRAIGQQDLDRSLDAFMLKVFDRFGIQVEELAIQTYYLGSAGVFADLFPGLPADGLTATTDRQRALAREDVQFLTWDHPLVTGALDLIIGSEKGNSTFAHWPDAAGAGLYLEAVFIVECVAPPQLHADRFLPPTPVRILVDHRGQDARESVSFNLLARELKPASPYPLLNQPELRQELLPVLLEHAESLAQRALPPIISQARRGMHAQLAHEIARLRELRKVNRNVRAEEIEALVQQEQELEERLCESRLRLDALRLIKRGPR